MKLIIHKGTMREGNNLDEIISESLTHLKILNNKWDYNFHVQTDTGYRVYFRLMLFEDA